MKDKETETAKSYDTIKPGINAHSKWYFVARQLDKSHAATGAAAGLGRAGQGRLTATD